MKYCESSIKQGLECLPSLILRGSFSQLMPECDHYRDWSQCTRTKEATKTATGHHSSSAPACCYTVRFALRVLVCTRSSWCSSIPPHASLRTNLAGTVPVMPGTGLLPPERHTSSSNLICVPPRHLRGLRSRLVLEHVPPCLMALVSDRSETKCIWKQQDDSEY